MNLVLQSTISLSQYKHSLSFFFFSWMPGIELRTSHLPGRNLTSEPYPWPCPLLLILHYPFISSTCHINSDKPSKGPKFQLFHFKHSSQQNFPFRDLHILSNCLYHFLSQQNFKPLRSCPLYISQNTKQWMHNKHFLGI